MPTSQLQVSKAHLGCSVDQGSFAGPNRATQQNSPLPVLVSITACCVTAWTVVLHSVSTQLAELSLQSDTQLVKYQLQNPRRTAKGKT